MVQWDEVMRPEYSRILALDQYHAALFATACVDHVLWVLQSHYANRVPAAHQSKLLAGVRSLWELLSRRTPWEPDLPERIAAETADLAPDEDSPDPVPGWSDLVFAVVAATYCFRGRDIHKRAFDAAGGAYQALRKQEVYSVRKPGWKPGDSRASEEASAACRDEISFQLTLLAKIEAGEEPGSSLFARLAP